MYYIFIENLILFALYHNLNIIYTYLIFKLSFFINLILHQNAMHILCRFCYECVEIEFNFNQFTENFSAYSA